MALACSPSRSERGKGHTGDGYLGSCARLDGEELHWDGCSGWVDESGVDGLGVGEGRHVDEWTRLSPAVPTKKMALSGLRCRPGASGRAGEDAAQGSGRLRMARFDRRAVPRSTCRCRY